MPGSFLFLSFIHSPYLDVSLLSAFLIIIPFFLNTWHPASCPFPLSAFKLSFFLAAISFHFSRDYVNPELQLFLLVASLLLHWLVFICTYGWMDGWESRLSSSWPFTTSLFHCISTGKACNVPWSPLFPLLLGSLWLSEHRLEGVPKEEILSLFVHRPPLTSHPAPFPFDPSITSPSITLFSHLAHLLHTAIKLDHIFKWWDSRRDFNNWWFSILFPLCWCHIHYLMVVTFCL